MAHHLHGPATSAPGWRRLATHGLWALIAASLSSVASARDPQAGQAKAAACAVCHGQLGISNTPDAPHLAGQPALYVATQLRAYRSGARKHEVMAVMAKPLSDDDIDNLAAWYASIRIEAQSPR